MQSTLGLDVFLTPLLPSLKKVGNNAGHGGRSLVCLFWTGSKVYTTPRV